MGVVMKIWRSPTVRRQGPRRTCSLARAACVAFVAFGVSMKASAEPCPPRADLNGDGQVNVTDLLTLLDQWGPCPAREACPADLTLSGGVGTGDLLMLLESWGPAPTFDYGARFSDPEALQIGMEMLGIGDPMTLPPAMYDRVVADQRFIRDAVPFLKNQPHQKSWDISRFMVRIDPADDLGSYHCRNAFYAVTNEAYIFSFEGKDWYILDLNGALNIPELLHEYQQLPGVDLAIKTGNEFGFGTLVFWEASRVDDTEDHWHWRVRYGTGGCLVNGCPCYVIFDFLTTPAGDVNLVDFEAGPNGPGCPAPSSPPEVP